MPAANWKWLVALSVPLALKAGDMGLIRLSSEGEATHLDLTQLPLRLGEWTGREHEVPPREVRGLGRIAVVNRTYTDKSGRSISAAFIYSNRREGLHLPQNCLVSQGWTLIRETTTALRYDLDDRRSATANLVVAMDPEQHTIVQLYLFVDAAKTATGWGRQYMDMIKHGRAGGKVVCLLLLTCDAGKREGYQTVQSMMEQFLCEALPHVHRSMAPGI